MNALQLRGLTKRFGGHLALDGVDLDLAPGEVRGLVGENGAGKSTLIKLLAGIYTADEGSIEVNGRIAFVHQDLGLVDELTVGENLALTSGFPRRARLIDWKAVYRDAEAAYQRMGLVAPDPRTLVGRLTAAEKALLGIVRALAKDASVAVLDEPTASLPAPDVAYLLEALRKLKESGTSILYVTHRLQELYSIADSVTVLRGGRMVAQGPIADYDVDRLVEAMLGRPVGSVPTSDAPTGTSPVVLDVQDLTVPGGVPVSFRVHEREIVGVVGLRGAGHEALGRAIAGAERTASGSVLVGGQALPATGGVSARMKRGVALLPADRQRESTFPGMSLVENLFPGPRNRAGGKGLISAGPEGKRAETAIAAYEVRPPRPQLPIDQLSGGNQQKICVARVLGQEQKLVVLEEPTAGVDVGSKLEIHNLVRAAAAEGTGVLVVSSDVEEIVQLCTRVLVVVGGGIAAEATGDQITQERLIVLASSAPSHIDPQKEAVQ